MTATRYCAWRYALLLVAAVAVGNSGAAHCPEGTDTTFEVLTGFVLTLPDAILHTKQGVLRLDRCIDICRRMDGCEAVNFEIGLCVLFAKSDQDALKSSQFPVFTMFAHKICLRSRGGLCPDKAWAFDRVVDFRLAGFEKHTRLAETTEACMELCLDSGHFVCRSASYDRRSKQCTLSDMDRHTAAGSVGAFKASRGSDYLENQCASAPLAVCNFKPVEGSILKTVDAVYANVISPQQCKKLCMRARFRCHSFDYGDTADGVCRLSHHSGSSLRGLIREPYLKARGATTMEMGSCYNVTVECKANYMVARVTTNKVFSGKLYGKSRPNSCHVDVHNSLDFEINLGFNDLECDVVQDVPGRFTTDVVIQHHDRIVTSSDVGLKVRCNYELSNRTVSNAAKLAVAEELRNQAEAENSVVTSPNVTLRVTNRYGADITSAKVGDPLALRFEIMERFGRGAGKVAGRGGSARSSPYEIFVRELVAMDGLDSSEILLIDSKGCPTDYSIMGVLREVNNSGQVLQADFDAFKFPTSDVVQFRALVTPCIPRCDPVQCDVTDYYGQSESVTSYGRKRRRRSTAGKDLMVAGVIHISDRFDLDGDIDNDNDGGDGGGTGGVGEDEYQWSSGQDHEWTSEGRNPKLSSAVAVSCLDSFSFAVGATLFLLAQCALIGAWTYLYHKNRRLKDTGAALQPVGQHSQKPGGHGTVLATVNHPSSPPSSLPDYDHYFGEAGVVWSAASGRLDHESLSLDGGSGLLFDDLLQRRRRTRRSMQPHQQPQEWRRSNHERIQPSNNCLEESADSFCSHMEPRSM